MWFWRVCLCVFAHMCVVFALFFVALCAVCVLLLFECLFANVCVCLRLFV